MPHKRKRRLKHHKELVEMEATDPDSEDIYSESLRTHYLCLHDFVAKYNYYGKDASRNRNYKNLTKPRLVNHRVIDPNNEYKRGLLLLSYSVVCALQG